MLLENKPYFDGKCFYADGMEIEVFKPEGCKLPRMVIRVAGSDWSKYIGRFNSDADAESFIEYMKSVFSQVWSGYETNTENE